MTAVTSRFLFVNTGKYYFRILFCSPFCLFTDYSRKLIIEFELVLVVAVDQVSEVGRGYLFQMIYGIAFNYATFSGQLFIPNFGIANLTSYIDSALYFFWNAQEEGELEEMVRADDDVNKENNTDDSTSKITFSSAEAGRNSKTISVETDKNNVGKECQSSVHCLIDAQSFDSAGHHIPLQMPVQLAHTIHRYLTKITST